MKILYVYHLDPEDINTQSGRPKMILNELQRRKWEVRIVLLDDLMLWVLRAVAAFSNRIGLYKGDTYRCWWVAEYMALRIKWAAREFTPDIIFSPSSFPFRNLRHSTCQHIVACADTLLPGFIKYYGYDRSRTAKDMISEAKSIENCTDIFLPTQWAAAQLHELPLKKMPRVHVAPFGANLKSEISRAEIQGFVQQRKLDSRINLVSIVSDWERKGGELLVGLANRIAQSGRKVLVTVIGIKEVTNLDRSPLVEFDFVGRLNKNEDKDWMKFHDILSSAHFFCMPSKGEAFGMSMCEAASFGVPMIGSTHGGLKEIIKNQETGIYLDNPAEYEKVCEFILKSLDPWRNYESLCDAVRTDYEMRLNWQTFVSSTFSMLDNDLCVR